MSPRAPWRSVLAGLDPAIRPSIARDHDLAFDADAQGVEGLVIVDQSEAGIDDLGGDVAARRGAVESQDLRSHRGRIARHRRLHQREGLRRRAGCRNQPESRGVRLRQEYVVRREPSVEAPRLHEGQHVIPRHRLLRSPRHVGDLAQCLGPQPRRLRIGTRDQRPLDRILPLGGRGREAHLLGGDRRGEEQQSQNGAHGTSEAETSRKTVKERTSERKP